MAWDVPCLGRGGLGGTPSLTNVALKNRQKGASARFLPPEWLGATVGSFNLLFRAGALFLHHYVRFALYIPYMFMFMAMHAHGQSPRMSFCPKPSELLENLHETTSSLELRLQLPARFARRACLSDQEPPTRAELMSKSKHWRSFSGVTVI